RRLPDFVPFGCPRGGLLALGGEPLLPFVAGDPPRRARSAPGHGERAARLERRPWGLGKHADAVGQADDSDRPAGDHLGFGIVDLVGNRAFHRRAQDRAVEHARYLHVDAITRAAVDLAGEIYPLHIFADEPELAWLL